ncbi:hypothetical protein [Candidatus Tisiphia endosymbiont of Hybos culiciformis]
MSFLATAGIYNILEFFEAILDPCLRRDDTKLASSSNFRQLC